MPGKKKKGGKKSGKKKKKSARPTSGAGSGAEGAEDPETLVDPGSADGKKKKKKKVVKKKLTKAEKAQEKLEKECSDYKANDQLYEAYVDRMDRWLRTNYGRSIDLFRKFDTNGDGVVSYEEFKSGMTDLGAPCTALELHLLCKLLDRDGDETIDYLEFSRGIRYVRESDQDDDEEEEEDDLPRLVITRETLDSCPLACCKMGHWKGPYREKNPKYIDLELRLVTFDKMKNHPGHFNITVHAHLTIFGVIQIIKEETDIATTRLKVFRDDTRTQEALLFPDMTLAECGYEGDSRQNPEEVTLYYDYGVEFNDCPLLLCDYYFD
ncbi:PREDICTED: uncharacterized protein LOC109474060 [Branchiostoma belcheri]|uniref:Uncharacterized protein LOC109474060 n=1 Tax=Branchiostoma belcheri TaxID=7741 RepID=A0A6P4ZFG7_BRABE|nr:PREDICTED: uncharacterized protein LOC109474060 [Branchiostoma belcheri]XP_019629837.1 PREDICTED: uncharacterized protein LOC109474060 [Branchiostoma belcheri]